MTVADACSCANFNDVRVRHISLKWDVHFSMQVISGSASLNCQLINDVDHINLDVKELAISSITVNGIDVRYRISPNAYSFYGSTLKVYLPEELSKAASTVAVLIKYSTSKEASALQWLKVAQTADKLAPYLLSQCQPIHARSLLPCMDTPAIKQTYDAQVRVASDLTCLMSALSFDNPHDEHDHTTFYFRQPMPIPTYLIAIVVGRLSKRDISDRCAIWSEPSIADVAKNEFIEVEEILGTAEDIVGKYLWGRLDLICMPPSFPFGGMENPCLIFVTPTIIAGDRSLVNVIAHEVAHSWAGNLVTNANWDDFWLNEGFATFIERKILGRLVSEEYRQFMSYNGWHSTLKSTVYNEFSSTHRFTRMIQKHKNTDPDESFSAIPYEKGSALLLLIEQKIGDNDLFDAYIRDYIREFALKSVTSAQWKDHLYKFFEQKHDILNSIDFDKWFHGTGMPPEQPKFDTKMVDACQSLTNRWIHGSTEEVSSMNSDQYDKLAPSQKIEFLSMLWQYDAPLEEYKLEKLNELYRLNATSNFEILYFWIRLAIKSHWEPIIEVALSFLAAQGRMKYSRPVYKDLVSWPASRVMARDHFLKNRISMHPIAVEMIAKDLHLRNPSMSVAF